MKTASNIDPKQILKHYLTCLRLVSLNMLTQEEKCDESRKTLTVPIILPHFAVIQLLSPVSLFVTPWTVAH